MSTEILEDDKLGIYLTRFFGGEKRGVCYQITVHNGCISDYVQLTKAQMTAVLKAYEQEPRI